MQKKECLNKYVFRAQSVIYGCCVTWATVYTIIYKRIFFCVYNNNKRKPNTVSVSVWVKNKNVCKLNILYYKYLFVLLIPAHDRAVIL